MRLDTLLKKSWRGAVAVLGVTMILGLIPMHTLGQGTPPPPMQCTTTSHGMFGCKDYSGSCSTSETNWDIIVSCDRKCCYVEGQLYSETWTLSSNCWCVQLQGCCDYNRNCTRTADMIKDRWPCPRYQQQ
ncbi:MAG: hypothetical protein HRF45_03235 [Fimbriimonadia bacterium]|jgi:hypothetical protein